jgi:hypothetical protein
MAATLVEEPILRYLPEGSSDGIDGGCICTYQSAWVVSKVVTYSGLYKFGYRRRSS